MENIVQLQLVAKVTKKTEDKGTKEYYSFPFLKFDIQYKYTCIV